METGYSLPFLQQMPQYAMAFDYDASGNQIYIGWSQPGVQKSEAHWRIMKQTFNASNQVTDILWPNNSIAFRYIWDNRASLTYGGTTSTIYSALILVSPNGTRWAITVLTNGDLYTATQPSGPSGAYAPTSLVLQDSFGVFWDVSINNSGALDTEPGGSPSGALTSITLQDSSSVSWILTVLTDGSLKTT